ncbi:MAG: hypothetical protein LBK06_04580, partial [Planctomycetaceae bacterium]|nr:hypothetical protein [Planctomycetaceae bacterium]
MNIVGNFGRVIFGLVVFLGLVFYFGENVFSAGGDNLLLRETFERDARGWESERAVRVFAVGNVLRINPNKDSLTEAEPVISKAYNLVGSQLRVIIDVRTLTASELVINWTTKESPTRDDIKRLAQKLNTDGEYHKVGFFLPVSDMLETLSLKFTSVSGMWEIRSIEFYGQRTEPISLRKVSQFRQKNTDGTEREMLRYSVRNDAPFALNFNVEQPDGVDDLSVKLSRNQTIDFGVPVKPSGNLSAVRLVLRSSDSGVSDWFPEAIFPVFLYDPKPDADWITSKLGQYIFELSPDARIARVKRGGEVVAIIAPIVHCGGVIPDFKQKKAAEIITASDNR